MIRELSNSVGKVPGNLTLQTLGLHKLTVTTHNLKVCLSSISVAPGQSAWTGNAAFFPRETCWNLCQSAVEVSQVIEEDFRLFAWVKAAMMQKLASNQKLSIELLLKKYRGIYHEEVIMQNGTSLQC